MLFASVHGPCSARAIQTADSKRFESAVWIALAEQGPWTDAKSIARVMAMKTPHMATLYFVADGEDADAATAALMNLVESDFADDDNGR